MSKAKKIGILTVGQGINVLINLLFLPYMARALSYEENGTYGQVIIFISFVVAALSLGLPQILNVFLGDSQNAKDKIYSSSIFSSLMLGCVGFLSIFMFSSAISVFLKNEQLGLLLKIYSFSIIVQGASLILNSFLVFEGKIKTSIFLIIITNIIKIILVTVSIQIYHSLTYAMIGITISHFLYFLIGTLLTYKNITTKFTKSQMYMQLRQGFPLGLTYVVGLGIIYTDSMMVSKMLGTKDFAIYRNGAIEVPFLSSIYGAIAAIILPEITKLWSEKQYQKIIDLKKKVIKNSIYLIYPVLVFLFFKSKAIIILYLGENYSDSAFIFSIFSLLLLVRINDYTDILIASKNSHFILVYNFVIFILNIALNFVFIYFFGAIGAALSSVICILLLAFLQFKKIAKILHRPLHEFFDFKQIGFVFLICIATLLTFDFILIFLDNEFTHLLLLSIFYFSTIFYIFIKKIDVPLDSVNNKFLKRLLNVRHK